MSSKKSVTCIDVGTDAIKMATGVKSQDGKLFIQKILHFPFPAGSFSKYGLDIQTEKIGELLAAEKIRGNVYVTLSNPKNILQILSMPGMPKAELGEAVKWEMTQKKAFDPAKSFLHFLTTQVNFEPAGSNQKVFVHTQSKDEINKISGTLSSRKVKPLCFEYSNFALISALQNLGATPTNKAYIILNLGASSSQFIVVHNNRFVFERKLTIGGDALTKAISDYCKLDYEASEKIKKENGIDSALMSDSIIEARQILTSSLEKLVSDIQYSMKYFSFQVTKSKITTFEKVILTGGSANMAGIKDFIRERLSLDCMVADFSGKVTLPKGFVLPGKQPPWPIFATLFGLFFWDEANISETCTSLLPATYSTQTQAKTLSAKIWVGLGSAVVMVTLLASLIIWGALEMRELDSGIADFEGKNSAFTEELKTLEKEVEEKNQLYDLLGKDLEQLDMNLATERSKISAISAYGKKGYSPGEVCEAISTAVPQGVYLTELTFENNAVLVTGLSPTNDGVARLMKELNASGRFKNCNFLYTKRNKDGNFIEFEIKAEKV